MNNQFVGDFKDYLKYGLLDIISEITKMKVLIVWMATHDSGKVSIFLAFQRVLTYPSRAEGLL